MAEDQEWCSVLSQALQQLKEGFYVQEEVDVILQEWPGHSYDWVRVESRIGLKSCHPDWAFYSHAVRYSRRTLEDP